MKYLTIAILLLSSVAFADSYYIDASYYTNEFEVIVTDEAGTVVYSRTYKGAVRGELQEDTKLYEFKVGDAPELPGGVLYTHTMKACHIKGDSRWCLSASPLILGRPEATNLNVLSTP